MMAFGWIASGDPMIGMLAAGAAVLTASPRSAAIA
jgi:hypothetical protein